MWKEASPCRVLVLSLALAVLLGAAQALPARLGFVNDYAQLIDGASRFELERIGGRLQAATGGQVVVVTLRSLRGRPAEEVAQAFATEWEVWTEGQEEPSVLLLLTTRGDIQVVTSDAANAFASGERIGALIQRDALPLLQAGEPGRGLLEVVRGIEELYEIYFNLR